MPTKINDILLQRCPKSISKIVHVPKRKTFSDDILLIISMISYFHMICFIILLKFGPR